MYTKNASAESDRAVIGPASAPTAVSATVTPQVHGAGADPLPPNVLASPSRAANLPVASQPSTTFPALPPLDATSTPADPPLRDVPESELDVGVNLVYVACMTVFCERHGTSRNIPIAPGTLVTANKVLFGGKRSLKYNCWGCLSPKVLKNLRLRQSDPKEVPGYALLSLNDQTRVRRAWLSGRIDAKDLFQSPSLGKRPGPKTSIVDYAAVATPSGSSKQASSSKPVVAPPAKKAKKTAPKKVKKNILLPTTLDNFFPSVKGKGKEKEKAFPAR